MSVALNSLLSRLPASTQVVGERGRQIETLEIDSRRVTPGALFVAVSGEQTDGHTYIGKAIASGAIAVVVEAARGLSVSPDVTAIHVPDSRRALSLLAAAFYNDPSHAVDVVGVTGTNGKTTTTRMIAAILQAAGKPCGVIGTVGAEFGERTWDLANTTPLAPELHSLLAQMRDAGASAVAMEVSSHALVLDRVEDVRFRAAALTNITRDHLDFHGTLDAYAAAKRRLFSMAQGAAINVDDAFGKRWEPGLRQRIPTISYSLHGGADLVPVDVKSTAAGSQFVLGGESFTIALPGAFNVSNALAAIAIARLLGVDFASCARGLASLQRVRGRMEHVGPSDIDVVVDYSHTPDALENALVALRSIAPNALAVVFGCGGDRDKGKRPEMGRIAAAYADRIYVTSDNPRSEVPTEIIAQIEGGMGGHEHVSEPDRRSAITRAIEEAKPGDVVLVAGKGHETYQIVGSATLPFDDVEVAREALARRARETSV